MQWGQLDGVLLLGANLYPYPQASSCVFWIGGTGGDFCILKACQDSGEELWRYTGPAGEIQDYSLFDTAIISEHSPF